MRSSNAVTAGTVALDANALLDLYRVGNDQRTQIFAVLETVGSRLFVPHQAALEFQRNRLSVASDSERFYESLISSIEPKGNVLNVIGDPELRKQLQDVLDEAAQQLTERIDRIRAKHAIRFDDIRHDDPVRARLDRILSDGCVGRQPDEAELATRRTEATRRLKQRIPPGCKDESKDDASGDFLIWAELLEHRKLHDRPLLFVTNDEKNDWYRARIRGQAIGPRPELVAEMLALQPNHCLSPGEAQRVACVS